MAGVGADFWVCGDCRSVNNLRSKQCYNCRTPKDVAEVDPAQIEGTGHGRLREIALPGFKASRVEAALASALIILVAVTQVVSTNLDARLLGRVSDDPDLLADPAFLESFDVLLAGTVAVIVIGVALLALTAWAYWLSRVVTAMPALGLGYPPTTGMMAFIENFLPGLNLFRVPAIVRDVMRRLEPGHTRGEALIFAAWIGLLGGILVPRFGGFLAVLETGTIEEAVRRTILIQGVSTGLVLVGSIFLVVLIWWIEQRVALRREAQLEAEPAPAAAGVGSPEPAGIQVPGSAEPAHIAPAAMVTATLASRSRTESSPEGAVQPRPVPPPGLAAPAPGSGAPPTAYVAAAVDVRRERPLSGSVVPDAPPVPDPQVAPGVAAAPEWPGDPAPPQPAEPAISAVGSVAASSAPDPVLTRPITAVTGAASVPTGSLTPPPEASPEASPAPAEAPTKERAPAAVNEPSAQALRHAPTGPLLHLRVENATTMIGTVEAESEAITLDGLRQAAPVLARANGSAMIATAANTFEARKLAQEAFQILSDARVQTTIED